MTLEKDFFRNTGIYQCLLLYCVPLTYRPWESIEISRFPSLENQNVTHFFVNFAKLCWKLVLRIWWDSWNVDFSEIWVVSRSFQVQIFRPLLSHTVRSMELTSSSGMSGACLTQRPQHSCSASGVELASWLMCALRVLTFVVYFCAR